MAEIEVLRAKAEALKAKERAGVIEKIRSAIDHYGLTASDLGLGKASGWPVKSTGKSKVGRPRKSSARYADGNGNTWTGMGPRPKWFRDALESGRTAESMLTTAAEPSHKGNGKAKGRATGKPVAPKYRDEAGNTWSGRGSRPVWFREALASGKTPEQLSIG